MAKKPDRQDFEEFSLPEEDWAGEWLDSLEMSSKKKKGPGIRIVWIALLVLCLAGAAVAMLAEKETSSPSQAEQPREETQSPEPQIAGEYGYYGRKLDPEYREVYDRLYLSILNYETQTPNVILPEYDALDPIVHALHMDHPELFWFRGEYSTAYHTAEDHVEITVTYVYDIPAEEIPRSIAFVEQEVREVLTRLQDKGDYEKVKGVYDFLIDRTVYDGNYQGSTLYDFLYHGRGVCEGYARMTQYLLKELGMEVIYVEGEAGPAGNTQVHAWNIVRVEGEYYQLDTTWGDPANEDKGKNYTYFLVTDEEMSREHFPDTAGLPACNATACNYYRKEGNYLASFDEQTLRTWMSAAASRGIPLEFKCANQQVYDRTVNYLFKEGHFWDVMQEALGTIYEAPQYYHNDVMYIISVPIEW